MKPSHGWWRRLMVPLVVCAMGVATVGIAVPSSATAAKTGAVKMVPVQRLSSVVMSLIKTVEGSTALACETRNSVVRRLRELDDALLSGRRSAAVALASAWRQDAWSMEAARVIGPELGSSLQNRLSRLQGKIGWGYAAKPGPTRHWEPLPSCDTVDSNLVSGSGVLSGPGVAASATSNAALVGSYNPTIEDPMADLKIFLKIGVGLLNLLNIAAPGLGTVLSSLLGGAVDLMWPQGTQPDMANLFQEVVDTTTYNLVKWHVDEIGGQLGGTPGGWDQIFAAWQYNCQHTYGGFDTDDCAIGARGLYNQWYPIYSEFIGFRSAIQKAGDQVKLLPLFAAYDNLFLPFLSQGVQLHRYWQRNVSKGWLALDEALVDGKLVPIAADAMDKELDPDYVEPRSGLPDRGVGYVNYIYKNGLAQQPAASKDDWGERNAWIRKQTLQVLDFRDIWKYMDPRAYPDGVPGGAKLTRMIYSDSVGQRQATPNLPTNVAGPLKEISIWTKDVTTVGQAQDGDLVISSVQSTSPPSLGPVQSGPIQGAADLLHNRAYYKNLADATCSGTATGNGTGCAGPIISAGAGRDRRGIAYDWATSAIGLRYAAGGGTRAGYWSQYQESQYFQYDDEVLATVQVVSHHHWSDNVGDVTDAVVFGFRYADSFNPAGQAIGSASGWCLTTPGWSNGQVTIHSCNQPTTSGQIWTYDPDLQQLSVTDPAVNPADNPNGVQAKYCLDTAGGAPGGGGTAAHTQVVVNPCDDGARFYDATTGTWLTSSQRWSIEGVGNTAKITNVKSGLVLDMSTASGQLNPYNGTAYQKWRGHDPLTGEIHGIASGKCVDVPNYSTTPGTQVQLYECHGNWAQQWTYNPTNKELIYTAHPSLCLEVRNGGGSGSAVQINTCNGWPRQQWTLKGDGSTIVNFESGLVMDATGGGTTNGTLVQIWGSNGSQAQKWSRTSNQGGAVYGIGAGKCLDLPSSLWTSGTQLLIHSCYSPLSAAQTWIYHPIAQIFTVNSPSGPKCLDTAGGGTAEHTAVVINDCTGAASQRWALDFARSTISNVNSVHYDADGKLTSAMVLGVTGGATADGSTVELTQSVGADGTLLTPTSSQQWVWSLN